ncbi:MAG: shikimate kinase [Armatimonadetes bacterium]|nr:shikimate kinase [Armatimonadota bacterium]
MTNSVSWILVGMMGVGKSAVGREIASITGRQFVDTDILIQRRLGRSIQSFFQHYGEAAFREHETRVLEQLKPGNTIVSTGGGIILREENWVQLHRIGVVIYLKASAETLTERLERSSKKRPLLQVENWKDRVVELAEKREEFYSKADYTVLVTTQTIAEMAQDVIKTLGGQ